MACAIVEEKLFDQSVLNERVSGWDEFREFIRGFAPEKMATVCDVDPKLIREAARLYATTKPAMCFHGLGLTEQRQGTDGVMCLVNLALLTGNFGKTGSGVNPLRGQNNVQGAAHMGCEPGNLTGMVALDEGRTLFETVWQTPVPRARGLDLMQMMDAASDGKFKALWAIGYDVALTNPDANATAQSLKSLEFVDRPGHVPQRNRARMGPCVFPGSFVFRARWHVHEFRATHPARAQGHSRRREKRRSTGKLSATSPARWANANFSIFNRRKKSGKKFGASGKPVTASPTRDWKKAGCNGRAQQRITRAPQCCTRNLFRAVSARH